MTTFHNTKTMSLTLAAMLMSVGMHAQTDSIALQDGVMTGTRNLTDVVVTGTRDAVDVRHLPMTVTVIEREKLTEQNQVSVLPTVMQQVPGLFVTSRGMMGYGVSTGAAGGISLRGLSGGSGQVMVLIDGHPQYNGVYGHPISDSYQTLMAKRVEVLRGPASVLYGSNAMGGVINIVTRGTNSYYQGYNHRSVQINVGAGSYGTVQTEASYEEEVGPLDVTAAAQYSRSDNHRPHMGFEQYGGFFKLSHHFNEFWNAFADINLTHFNASNPGEVSVPKLENDQWITRGAANLVIANHYRNTNGALSIYDNFGRHKINDGYNDDGVSTPQTDLFRSKDAVAGVSWYQSAQFFEGNRITAGVDYQHIYGRAYYTDRKTGETVTTPRRLMQSTHTHENEVAGYVDIRQDFLLMFTIDAGLRYDHHSTAGDEWVPQAGLVFRPTATAELKASLSKGFRNPTTKDLYLYGIANHDSLYAERMMNYELAWKQRLLGGQLTYGINLFIIDGDNIIQTVAGKNMNSGEFRNSGVEMEAAYRITPHWTVSTNHSYLHMRQKLIAAPTYKAFLGADFHSGKWTANAGLQYINHLYTATGANEQTESFTLLNLAASYALHKNVALWLRGENLLAQRYELNLGYPMPKATFMGGVNVKF